MSSTHGGLISSSKTSLLLILGSLVVTQFINHSPYSMERTAPVHDWADAPVKLVATPYFETKKEDIFTAGATHMALVHNAMIRGFNSIYQQAPLVLDDHKSSFVGYTQTWARFVRYHQADEENMLFNKVSVVLDDDKIWAATHKEHAAVSKSIGNLEKYLTGLAHPRNVTSDKMLKFLDDILPHFEQHMHNEVKTIANLVKHPRAPLEGSAEAVKAKNIFAEWGKKTVTKAGLMDVLPFFLLNLDRTAEEGIWADWPPMPHAVRWTLTNVFGMVRGRLWKFSSCDYDGIPKELYAYNPKLPEDDKNKK